MMRVVSPVWMLALAVSTMGGAAESTPSHGTLPAPITTRQTLFSIPFLVDRAEQTGREPVEVLLYVSTDRGANWQLYDRVKPLQARFQFRAVTDGEYWFAIRTLDRSGGLRPEREEGPGLRVVVDTTLPELQLEAQQGEAGQIVVRWQVAEPYLAPDSLKIQCRSDASRPWQSVAIDRQSIKTSGPTWTGEVVWWPQLRSERVEIRAEVADTAGNSAVSHAQVSSGRTSLAGSGPEADPNRNLESDPAGTVGAPAPPWRPSTDLSPPAVRQDDPAGLASYPGPPIPTESRPDDPLPGSSRWNERALAGVPAPAAGDPPAWRPPSSVAVDGHPAIQNQYPPPPQEASQTSGYTMAAGERPQMVNSRLFELEYRVDSVGPSGLGCVELWGTRDGGLTWTRFGTDNDSQSPMLVAAPGEGIYGFRVAVRNGVGVGGQKPQSGDPPDVWIGVDLTQPTARILSVDRVTGDQAGQLIISWEANDQMLSAQPVSLSYSDTPGGPWSTIARGLENTGRYCWPVDRRLPARIYLLLEVVDEAGNVGTFETSQAIPLDPVPPTVRIHNVRPMVDSARTPTSRYRSR